MTAARRSGGVDLDQVRLAKENLIAQGALRSISDNPVWLPGEIDRSWRRSITAGAVRTPGAVNFVNEVDSDSELCRAALPVLDRLEATLHDMGTAIFLADRAGQIVARRVSGSDRHRFDNACAAEGFDFSEESIGTNGLGTAISEGSAVFVRGPEHFNDALEQLACAGTGIRHPATGRLIGSLSLAAPVDAAEMLMLAMAREGARQIVDNLSATVSRRELALGRSYQRHRAKGPVIVLNNDTVMTNVTGLSFLNVEMHARLWDSLLSQDWEHGPHVLDLDFDSLQARVLAHRLEELEDAAFAVEILDRKRHGTSTRTPSAKPAPNPFVATLRNAATRHTGALSVTGPTGSGKLHIVLEWLRDEGHPAPLVLEGDELSSGSQWRRLASTALEEGGAVVVRRVEDLDAGQVGTLRSLVDGVGSYKAEPSVADASSEGVVGPPSRLVLTADLARCSDHVARMLSQVSVGLDVPPLASRREDIPSMVKALLDAVEPRQRPMISAATMQALMRWDWPGNVTELRRVVEGLAAEMPGQAVSPYHLPERMWDAANRRPLTRLESAERSEILAALRQSNGNRSKAAALLGIGRTTLYRKLHQLGIDDETLLP